MILKTLISMLRCDWLGLELNSAGMVQIWGSLGYRNKWFPTGTNGFHERTEAVSEDLEDQHCRTSGHIHTKLLCIFITGTQQPSDFHLKYIQKAVSLEVILSSFVCRCHLVSYCILHPDIFNCDFLEPLYILEYVWGVEKVFLFVWMKWRNDSLVVSVDPVWTMETDPPVLC